MPTTDEPDAPTGTAEITRDAAGVPVIKLVGEIDLSNVDSVRAAIEPTVSSAPELVVFDLSGLDFLDSSGCMKERSWDRLPFVKQQVDVGTLHLPFVLVFCRANCSTR